MRLANQMRGIRTTSKLQNSQVQITPGCTKYLRSSTTYVRSVGNYISEYLEDMEVGWEMQSLWY